MRNLYLVSYDITDDVRLRTVFRTMKGYGEHLQYSVFICNLSPKEKALMVEAISDLIDRVADKVMIVESGPAEGTSENRIEFLGRHELIPDREAVVI